MSTVPATISQNAVALRHELEVEDVIAQVKKIQRVMEAVMKKDEHYGVIPGTNKPTLLKPGAEKLCLTFRLDPQYESTEHYDGKHLTVKTRCTLWHIPTGQRFGSGEGSCSTKESKYAYRNARRKCPACSAETITRSKYPPRNRPKTDPGGWWCAPKGGGCGAEFAHDEPAVAAQEAGRSINEDVADQYNTVLKMANKRALVAGVLNVTAASDIFTQDLEDLPDLVRPVVSETERPATPGAKSVEVWPEPKTSNGGGPSYDPFGAVTMLTKMAGGQFKPESMEHYFGPSIRNKSALEKFRADQEALFTEGYDKLHADYVAWKTSVDGAAA